MNPQYPSSVLLGVLSDMVAATGQANGGKMILLEGTQVFDPNTPLAQLPQATYDGYAESAAIVWQTVHYDSVGQAVVFCLPHEFKPTGSTQSSTVQTIGLINAAGDALIALNRLDQPITFSSPNDAHLIGFGLTLGNPPSTDEQIYP